MQTNAVFGWTCSPCHISYYSCKPVSLRHVPHASKSIFIAPQLARCTWLTRSSPVHPRCRRHPRIYRHIEHVERVLHLSLALPLLSSHHNYSRLVWHQQRICTMALHSNTMPGGIFEHLDFIPHFATLALAINQFTQPSHCSSSISVSTTTLAFFSLLPVIYASALFLKDSLGGFPRRHDTLAYVKLSNEGICIPLQRDSEQRVRY